MIARSRRIHRKCPNEGSEVRRTARACFACTHDRQTDMDDWYGKCCGRFDVCGDATGLLGTTTAASLRQVVDFIAQALFVHCMNALSSLAT